MKRKNKENCSRAERGSVKNRRLVVLGGLALSGLAYLLWPSYTPKWATAEEPSIEAFTKSEAKKIKYIGKPSEGFTLDKAVQDSFASSITKDEKVKTAWYNKGGSTDIHLTYEKITKQACFTPEERQDLAEEYKKYVNYVFDYIFGAFGKQNEKPIVCVPKTSLDEAPRIAGIVGAIMTDYRADFILTDDKTSLALPKVGIILEEGTSGSDSFGLNIVWEESVAFKQTPILLTIRGPAYLRMQTPVTEAVHRIARQGTQTLLEKYVKNPKWPKDSSELGEIIEACSRVEEGVAHAVSHILTPQIAKTYGLAVDEKERSEKIAFEKSDQRYMYVVAAEKLVDPKDPFKLIRDYVADPEAVREKLGAKIR